MMNHADHAALSCYDDHAPQDDIIDASWLTLSLSYPSSPPPSEHTPFFKLKMMNHGDASLPCDENVNASCFTLSQPSSSSSSPPPRHLPFEYIPLKPPIRLPIDPQTFFHSQLITTLSSLDSHNDNPDLIPKLFHKDYHQDQEQDVLYPPSTSKVLGRRHRILPQHQPVKKRRLTKSAIVPPPFPWATAKRATVHTLDHLLSILKLKTISGTLECKFCKFQKDLQIDLVENFEKVTRFIEERRNEMRDRALSEWLNPVIPNCESCKKEKAMYPLMTKKRNMNWLFLMLSQMIGCCKLEHLKYFCKHADIHRTGAKDRLMYSTYFGLCKQLQPNRPFLP